MFPRVAEDILCVLVYLRTIVFFHGILMLCLDETTANLDGVQFVRADASIQDLFTAYFRIEEPFPVLLHDRDRKWEIIITHYQNGLIWTFLACLDRHFFFCLVCKFRRSLFVHHGIFGTDNIFTVRTENFLGGGNVKICCDLNQSVGCLFRRVELLLPWLRRRLGVRLFRGRFLLLRRCNQCRRQKACCEDRSNEHDRFRRYHGASFCFHNCSLYRSVIGALHRHHHDHRRHHHDHHRRHDHHHRHHGSFHRRHDHHHRGSFHRHHHGSFLRRPCCARLCCCWLARSFRC